MAEKTGIFHRDCAGRGSPVFTSGTDDLPVLPSDYVCAVYAILTDGVFGCGSVLGKRKTRSVYPGCVSDDSDQFLFQHRGNGSDIFIWLVRLSQRDPKEKTVRIPGSDDRGGTFSRCTAGSYGICDPAAKRKFPKSESERTADAESAAGQFTVRHLQRGADGYSGGGFAWRDRVWIDPGAGGIGGLCGPSDGSCICLGI